jgi:Domain of unknown function (DUF5666)
MRKNILSAFVTTLVLSGCLLAAAGQNQPAGPKAEGQEPRREGPAQGHDRVFGTIASVGVDRLEIKRMDGGTQTVMVNDQTQYREGRRDAQKNLQLEDLKPGDHVFVRGRTSDNKEFVALMVHRVSDEQMQRFSGERAFGEITSIDGNQIKVRNRQGEKTIAVNDQTVFMKDGQPITLKDLKAGDRVFAMGKETDGQFVAERVMTGQFRRGGGPGAYHHEGPEDH